MQELARPPRDLNPAVSTQAEAICVRAMAKNPANRYQAASDLRDDLLRALSGHDVAAPAVMRASDTALLDPVSATTAGARTERRRRAVGYTLLAIGSVVAAALVVFLLLQLFAGSESPMRAVPNVVDQSEDEAKQRLESFGFSGIVIDTVTSSEVEEGRVARQQPAAGEEARDGSTIQLWLSSGAPQVEVPDVVGMEENEAVATLREAGLVPRERRQVSDPETEPGTVLSVTPSVGVLVPADSPVDLEISAGDGAHPQRAVPAAGPRRARPARTRAGGAGRPRVP